MIKEQKAGLPTAELCRKRGLSPATFYKLKAKYDGIDPARPQPSVTRQVNACIHQEGRTVLPLLPRHHASGLTARPGGAGSGLRAGADNWDQNLFIGPFDPEDGAIEVPPVRA